MIKIMLKTVNDQNTLLEEDDIKNHTVIHGPSFHEGSQLVYKKKKRKLIVIKSSLLFSKIFTIDDG
jgi:hypothetical protein